MWPVLLNFQKSDFLQLPCMQLMTYSKFLLLWPPFPMVDLSNGGGSLHCSQAQAWEGWVVHSGISWRVKRRRKRPELKEKQFLLVQSLVCLFSVGKLANLGCCQYCIRYLKNNSAFANLGCLPYYIYGTSKFLYFPFARTGCWSFLIPNSCRSSHCHWCPM